MVTDTTQKVKRKSYFEYLKGTKECPVCGKRIGLFQGKLTHNGFCHELYIKEYQKYSKERRVANKPTA